jgi:hypothetical protein
VSEERQEIIRCPRVKQETVKPKGDGDDIRGREWGDVDISYGRAIRPFVNTV